jgi:hypothetical protein
MIVRPPERMGGRIKIFLKSELLRTVATLYCEDAESGNPRRRKIPQEVNRIIDGDC